MAINSLQRRALLVAIHDERSFWNHDYNTEVFQTVW